MHNNIFKYLLLKYCIKAGVPREELFITTKLWRTEYSDPVQACKDSLERLNLDYVDMYLIHLKCHNFLLNIQNLKINFILLIFVLANILLYFHWSIPELESDQKTIKKTPMHKVWEGMEACVEQGLTKSIGISNFNVQLMVDMLAYANIPPACNQVELQPYYQQEGFRKFCKNYDIAVVAYSPLSAPARPVGGECRNVLEDPTIKEIADTHGKSPAQIALAWNLQLGNTVIPKTNTAKRAGENIEATIN